MICAVCSGPDATLQAVGRVHTELCRECIEGAEGAISRWLTWRMSQLVREGRWGSRPPRAHLTDALRIIDRDGYVTTRSLSAEIRITRRSTCTVLSRLVRAGHLESDTFPGSRESRYFRAEPRRAPRGGTSEKKSSVDNACRDAGNRCGEPAITRSTAISHRRATNSTQPDSPASLLTYADCSTVHRQTVDNDAEKDAGASTLRELWTEPDEPVRGLQNERKSVQTSACG